MFRQRLSCPRKALQGLQTWRRWEGRKMLMDPQDASDRWPCRSCKELNLDHPWDRAWWSRHVQTIPVETWKAGADIWRRSSPASKSSSSVTLAIFSGDNMIEYYWTCVILFKYNAILRKKKFYILYNDWQRRCCCCPRQQAPLLYHWKITSWNFLLFPCRACTNILGSWSGFQRVLGCTRIIVNSFPWVLYYVDHSAMASPVYYTLFSNKYTPLTGGSVWRND